MLRMIGMFQPFMRELVEMNYLQTNPVLMDDSSLRALLGAVKATGYEEGLRLSLEAYRKEAARA
jgi:hypothetical protein